MERSLTSDENVRERDVGFLRGCLITTAGFFLALTRLFGLPAPFAAAGICALDGLECVFMFVGAAAGYIINGGIEICVPYIAAMGALTIMQLLVGFFAHGTTCFCACGKDIVHHIIHVFQITASGVVILSSMLFPFAMVYGLWNELLIILQFPALRCFFITLMTASTVRLSIFRISSSIVSIFSVSSGRFSQNVIARTSSE